MLGLTLLHASKRGPWAPIQYKDVVLPVQEMPLWR